MKNWIIGGAILWILFNQPEPKISDSEIAALKAFKFIPVYKVLPHKTNNDRGKSNILFSNGKSGVYIIKEDNKIVYVGFSRTNLYRTIMRHFQDWNDRETPDRINYRYKTRRKKYTIRIVFAPAKKAFNLEKALILKYNPRDNAQKYESYLEVHEKIVDKEMEEYWESAKEPPPF